MNKLFKDLYMKKFYLFLLSVVFLSAISTSAFAQCPEDVNVDNITRPPCGSATGKFSIEMKGAASGATTVGTLNVSIKGTSTVYNNNTNDAGTGTLALTGLLPDLYIIKIANQATPGTICDSFSFLLRADYGGALSMLQTAATGCGSTNGSIKLTGPAATDSVSWISSYTPKFTVISSLTSNTISGLSPGLYYVTVKSPGTIYCYTTDTISVLNSGTACPAATFCANASNPDNLFPDGTFGGGSVLNSGPLPIGKTQYQYQPEGPYSPEDGFYAIANNTYLTNLPGGYISYHGGATDQTPFDNGWAQGWDNDHWLSPYPHTNSDTGYMMIVNADYDPNIVIEDTVNNLCVGKTYQFSAYIRSLNANCCGSEPANETFLIDGIGYLNTGNLFGTAPNLGADSADWHHVGFTFVANSTSAVFSLRNNSPGGQGNDFALDDIYVGSCVPTVVVTPLPVDVCNHPPLQDTALVTDASHLYSSYEWQVNKKDGNGYVFVGGVQTGTFGLPLGVGANSYYATLTLPIPLYVDSGWSYRVVVATNPANLPNPTCSFTSSDTTLIPNCGGPPTPVTFISVKAVLNSNIGDVYWQVGDQLNVAYYELEKSTDQLTYTGIASVPAIKGSSILNYASQDLNLTNGINYYRVKEVDNDGIFSYSYIVQLIYGGSGTVSIFPNPASDVLHIMVPAATQVKSAIIYDAIGRKILEQDNLNSSDPTISVSNLTTGFYDIKVITADGVVTNLNFVKK
jgi:type IX secretion system substrate protein